MAKLIPDTWKYNLFLIKSTSDFAKRKTVRKKCYVNILQMIFVEYEYDVSLFEKIFAQGWEDYNRV